MGNVIELKRGYDLPHRERIGGTVPVISSSGVIDHHRESKVSGPGVVMGRYGTLGQVFFIQDEFWPLNTALYVRDFKGNDPRFISYFLRCLDVSTYSDKAAVPGINRNHLHQEFVRIPSSISEQRAIAHILGTLDDKIELNRRINKTLQATARALFKSWFVDFDPVRARMEGRDTGLPKHIAYLFPDRMVDSELGEIPEGWEVKTLGEELKLLVSGARPRGGAVNAGVPSIGAENVIGLGQYNFSKTKYVPTEFYEKLKTKGAAVQNGDVLLYKDGAHIGRKTYLGNGFPYTECVVNEHVFILRLQNKETQRYLFFWLDQEWMTQEIISLNSNSAQPGINQVGVRSLPFLVPSREILRTFNQHTSQLTDRIFAHCHQSRSLAALRDALLPKLISGEIRVEK